MSFIRKKIKGSLACESEIVGGDFYTITVKLFAAGTITMLDRVSGSWHKNSDFYAVSAKQRRVHLKSGSSHAYRIGFCATVWTGVHTLQESVVISR